ncbi:SGNH/GDSL hydrolase family protein [Yonghaparkia sp. Soil809]|uniref:SGNH/GDSL hydrolase family protein n=1 Tax=Yonghaparkia sp. Soil809 TaxID=1736417 RepID=UPI0006FA02C1|nr:SGNH/GDSL hydrolase family protein [Yonghaparkia sp. Soil809]KRF30889.1 hypothetical protein ASG83_08520 [Yonghaparkia sp. Soil809]
MRAIDNATALAVRLQSPPNLHAGSPPVDKAMRPSVAALTPEIEARITVALARCGAELSADPAVVAMLDLLADLDRLVVVGDSLSADRCSWVEQLRGVLRALGQAPSIRNLARSGATTTDALAQLPGAEGGRRSPAVVLLGTNDLRRFDREARPRVSLPETLSSLDRIVTALEGSGHHATLVAPPRVDGERASHWPHFVDARIAWHPDDHAALVAGMVSLAARRGIAIITLSESDAIELSADGVHPTVVGHMGLLRTLLERLAARA